MPIDTKYVLNGLLRHNYFPNQKKSSGELPPIFSSRKFAPSIARKLLKVKQRNVGIGWDTVEYLATRFNGVSRALSLPHPLAYAHLATCIADNWDKIAYIESNKNSKIRPSRHKDRRLIIMDYEDVLTKA